MMFNTLQVAAKILAMLTAAVSCTSAMADNVVLAPLHNRIPLQQHLATLEQSTGDNPLDAAGGYAQAGHFDRALPIYLDFLKDHPDNCRALRGVGRIHFLRGHYGEALPYLKRAWDLADVDSLGFLALSLLRTGRVADVEPLLPSLLLHKEDSDFAAVILCFVVEKASKSKTPVDGQLFVKALDGLKDSDLCSRDDITRLVAVCISQLLEANERDEHGLQIVRRIIRGYEMEPARWPRSHLSAVGDAYFRLQRFAQAEEIFAAISHDPSSNRAIALSAVGVSQLYQGKYNDAATNLRMAWRLGDSEALGDLGIVYGAATNIGGLKDLIPEFVLRIDDQPEVRNTVIAYAVFGADPPDRSLFLKAIAGMTDEQILKREDTTRLSIVGLVIFGQKERAERLFRIRMERNRPMKG